MDVPEFTRLADDGRMLETAWVFGNWYGTSRDWVDERRRRGVDVLLEIDWQGAAQVREKDVGAITIQILPPSVEASSSTGSTSAGRTRRRASTSEWPARGRELAHYRDFDYLVVNGRFEKALEELEAVIRAERARTSVRARDMATFLDSLLASHPRR